MLLDVREKSSVPRWARMIDALSLLLATVALAVAMFGGFRQSIANVHVSVTSPIPLLLWAFAIAVVRQIAAPQRALYREFPARIGRWLHLDEVKSAVLTVVGTRLPILLVGYFAISLFGYANGRAPLQYFKNELLNLPVRWDAGWYLQIVTEGYRFASSDSQVQQNIVFFPAYPLLVRMVGRLLGGHTTHYVLAGMAVSLTAFFAALVYLYVLARKLVDEDKARYALWLIASYPFALFYGAMYSESLFLLGVVGAFYHLSERQFWQAAAWGLLAGLTKPNGALLSIPLALLAVSPAMSMARWRLRALATAAAPVAGMLLYAAFIWHLTGDPLAWARGQSAWERTSQPVTTVVANQVSFIRHAGLSEYLAVGGYDVLNMFAVLFALTAVWPVGRRIGLPYAALILVVTLPPIAYGGWLSAGRHSSVLFPIFLWLADVVPHGHRPAWIFAFSAFQALNAALFYTWRPMI